jgi:hypothetical protein
MESHVQAIAETVFDAFYLTTVTIMGISMIRRGGAGSQYMLLGWMALVLGGGDSFHLVSRVYALWTTGIEANAAALGFGKLVTSITMTFFYLMLYTVWKRRYATSETRLLNASVYALAVARIALSLFPQNEWFVPNPSLAWGIYRNIPFFLMGLIILVLYLRGAGSSPNDRFRFMWLAIALSFAFYAPVVLFASAVPPIGSLMIPKTLAYLWIVWMGHREMRERSGQDRQTGQLVLRSP